MQTVIFLDLDDTLFQTRPKCRRDTKLTPTAYSRDGSPLSFMTDQQRQLLGHISRDAIVIPTTARNHDAFQRVRLDFTSHVILNFGGVVLRPDRTLDESWDARVRPLAEVAGVTLQKMLERLEDFIETTALGVRARLISDFELPLYLVLKHPEGDLDALTYIQKEAIPKFDLGEFFVHRNHNNLSIVPKYLGKEKAVAYLLAEHFDDVCTIGVGDSLSDAPFLNLCDFCLLPSAAQLWKPMANTATPSIERFSGSYDPDDVTFLLKRVEMAPTSVAEKERLIQSGTKHYSEMISAEKLPPPTYLDLFRDSLERQGQRFAEDGLRLASQIDADRPGEIVLVSLARAGIPIGVLLTRVLREIHRRSVTHYAISIIRDRGIDEVALDHILTRHRDRDIVFVDGWTGKGVIAEELRNAVADYNRRRLTNLDSGLYVVSDLCGWAKSSATCEDYLLPFAILGCTISGLISRSILNDEVVGPGEFHGCLYYEDFAENDLSNSFVCDVLELMLEVNAGGVAEVPRLTDEQRHHLQATSSAYLAQVQREHGIQNRNHVKPGVGEATRVLLRRVPNRIFVRDASHPDVAHIVCLAQERGVPVLTEPTLPYLALALIEEMPT